MKVENIVCSGSFNQELNLPDLARAELIDYDPEMYHGGYIKTNGHSVTIYRSGKYILPGMKSISDMKATFESVISILGSALDLTKISEPQIKNMVCSSTYDQALDLSKLFIEMLNHDLDVSYEPESFPGLILKTDECTFNAFTSGKFLILGCTSEEQALKAEKYLQDFIDSIC